MIKLTVHQKAHAKLLAGNLWIFHNDIASIEGAVVNGAIVDVYLTPKRFLGKGYYNAASQISVRLLTYDARALLNEDFFFQRLQEAWSYRKKIGYTTNCRLVFGEADFLPALVIDKFGDYLSLQTLALGMDQYKSYIVRSLLRLFPSCKGIYERNDVPVRTLEGLTQQKGFLTEAFDTNIIIQEHQYQMRVDLDKGQKTGYFLDQADNRKYIQRFVSGLSVLDAFSYTGSFGISALVAGAKQITVLDSSKDALLQAKENYTLNKGTAQVEFVEANAFDQLKVWVKEKRKWDVVCIDPPALAKSRQSLEKALIGYKEINLRALGLVKSGGFLVTSSCTNIITQDLFLKAVYMAVKDARRQVREVYLGTQAPDHPVLACMENTHYLKFLVLYVS